MADRFHAAMVPPIEQAARAEYEYYGSTLTTNTALKVIVVILAGVIALLGLALLRATNAAVHIKPLVIRVNEVGRADAVAYQDFTYRPQAPEIRYFLTSSRSTTTPGITRPLPSAMSRACTSSTGRCSPPSTPGIAARSGCRSSSPVPTMTSM